MHSLALVLVCILVVIVHGWILLGHRHRMGSEPSDRSGKEPGFSVVRMKMSFVFLLAYQTLLCFRRIALEFGFWASLGNLDVLKRSLDFLPLPTSDGLFLGGTFLFIIGTALRVWSVITLGKFFTFEIGIRNSHSIIEKGPYRWIRHPSYTGYGVMLIASSFIFASGLQLIIVFVGPILFFILRIRNEERMLTNYFGEQYKSYMKRTKRLVPFIY